MNNDCRTRWEQVVKIHFDTKHIILRAEENLDLAEREHADEAESLDPKHQTYIQPIREERDAFEHICRGILSYLGQGKHAGDPSYLANCFEAARKHGVRAFFDAADWYGQVLRESIVGRLAPYSQECIRTALPDYYATHRGRIDRIAEQIVACREEKDTSDDAGTYQEVVAYGNLLKELENTYGRVRDAVPQLEELHTKEHARQLAERQEERKQRRAERPWSLAINVIAGLIVAALLAVGGYLLGVSHGQQSKPPGIPQPTSVLDRR